MLVGLPPYYNNNRKILFENIQTGPLRIPHTMSLDARDLILNLMNRNPKKRMGAGESDAAEIKAHAFFKTTDWDKVNAGLNPVPKLSLTPISKVNPTGSLNLEIPFF